jgi:hypothetical protein
MWPTGNCIAAAIRKKNVRFECHGSLVVWMQHNRNVTVRRRANSFDNDQNDFQATTCQSGVAVLISSLPDDGLPHTAWYVASRELSNERRQ